MYQTALSVLKKMNDSGFQAYIVGGYPRDMYLKRESMDIDICTSATPKQLKEIFQDSVLAKQEYGSVTVMVEDIRFEITTFRREIKYENNRFPVKIEYIDNLLEDLYRRDFIMNTLCIDANGKMIDLLGAEKDLELHKITCVGNAFEKIQEDILRSLRAIRFATILNFEIDSTLKQAIRENGYLLKNLSYHRRKEELDKIFSSLNAEYGISLLQEMQLEQFLDIDFHSLVLTTNPLGIWAQIKADAYPFSNYEKEVITSIQKVIHLNLLDPFVLYQYGLYICTLVGEIKNIDRSIIVLKYNELPIHSRKDIAITPKEICSIFKKEQGPFLKEILHDLEIQILSGTLENKRNSILNYLYALTY